MSDRPGRVYAHVGQPFSETDVDVLIVGGGRLGLACAFALRRLAPGARVLIVEREGIPSEGGSAIFARGVWRATGLPPEWRARAEWVRRLWADPAAGTGTVRPHDPPFHAAGELRLLGSGEPGEDAGGDVLSPDEALARLPEDARAQVADLVDLGLVERAVFDPRAGYGSATTLALAFGYGAVRLGADLLLNTEARLAPGGAELRRLDITPTMEIVVAETLAVRAAVTVVAAGAEGPDLLEHDLGVLCASGRGAPGGVHGRAHVQFPRLRVPPAPHLPLVTRAGFTVRPGAGGLRVLPPVLGPDPAGYAPTGGRLLGVPVGVRREVLDALLGALDAWPAFAGDRLDLGKVGGDVEGGQEARPRGGWPLHEEVAPGVHLLLGGPESDRVGIAVAHDLAARIAGVAERPWDGAAPEG